MKKPANSFEAVKLVLDKAPKDLTLVQRLVLIQIAHHYPTPHLSQKTLAAEIGAKRVDTVNRAVQALVKRDLLIVLRQGQARANKYELNYGSNVYGQTVLVTTRQTVSHVYGQTVLKQTSNKKENKERFFDFLSNFPNMTVDEAKVYRAWTKALLKGTSEDLLVTASQANREMLEPDAWLNFEKWKSYKPSDHDDWWGRAVND
jgi:hypothetical protein